MTTLRHPTALLCAGILALGLAGCGNSGSAQEKPSGGGQSSGAKADTEINMKDIEYVPKDATVKVGGLVRWTNGEAVAHTVTKSGGPGPEFDSGTLQQNATFEQKFTEAGKIDYVCEIHPNQTGTLTVK